MSVKLTIELSLQDVANIQADNFGTTVIQKAGSATIAAVKALPYRVTPAIEPPAARYTNSTPSLSNSKANAATTTTTEPLKPVSILVKTITGKTVKLQTPLSTSISRMRSLIRDKEGIPEDQQRLIYAGQLLGASPEDEDDAGDNFRSLQSYGVEEGSTLILRVGIRGS